MRIMKGDRTVMIGARTVSHLYKLQGCIVAGGVTYKGSIAVSVMVARLRLSQ